MKAFFGAPRGCTAETPSLHLWFVKLHPCIPQHGWWKSRKLSTQLGREPNSVDDPFRQLLDSKPPLFGVASDVLIISWHVMRNGAVSSASKPTVAKNLHRHCEIGISPLFLLPDFVGKDRTDFTVDRCECFSRKASRVAAPGAQDIHSASKRFLFWLCGHYQAEVAIILLCHKHEVIRPSWGNVARGGVQQQGNAYKCVYCCSLWCTWRGNPFLLADNRDGRRRSYTPHSDGASKLP